MEDIRDRQQYVTLEALMERNLARQEALHTELRNEIKLLSMKVDALEQQLKARTDGVRETILLTNKRISDCNTEKSSNIALWAIATAVGICAVQLVVSLISLFK